MIAKDKSGQFWHVDEPRNRIDDPIVVFCSKYVLTTGIKPIAVNSEPMSTDRYWDGWNGYAIGRDIHWTLEEAQDRAREMAVARVKSLEKALAKAKKAARGDAKFVGKKA